MHPGTTRIEGWWCSTLYFTFCFSPTSAAARFPWLRLVAADRRQGLWAVVGEPSKSVFFY